MTAKRPTQPKRPTKKPPADNDTRMVVLAMSPRLANVMRTALTRIRVDDIPEVQQIQAEISDQLTEMGR
jgi:hypothetical protein